MHGAVPPFLLSVDIRFTGVGAVWHYVDELPDAALRRCLDQIESDQEVVFINLNRATGIIGNAADMSGAINNQIRLRIFDKPPDGRQISDVDACSPAAKAKARTSSLQYRHDNSTEKTQAPGHDHPSGWPEITRHKAGCHQ
jgi:hypothetical protein